MANTRKTCLVTGCSEGGVGAALAEAFVEAGYHVFASARYTSKIPQNLHQASNVTILTLDVSSSSSIIAAAETVRGQTDGKLDVLINNAGHGLNLPALDTPISQAKKLFDTNFFGALEMVQVFSHMLVRSRGVIVNNASLGGVHPIPFISMSPRQHQITYETDSFLLATYNASKAALITAGEGWRLELAPLGVRVITLITGGISTKFLTKLEAVVLPEDSYYMSIKELIGEHPEKVPLGMDPKYFALDIVGRVERGCKGKQWVGGGSYLAYIAVLLLPQWALVSVEVAAYLQLRC